MLLRLILIFFALAPTARSGNLIYPTKFFQAKGEVIQLLGRPSVDERFTGFYVLEKDGKIHHIPGKGDSVRLDDGKPAEVIWFGGGKLFRLSDGRIESMGQLPQKWTPYPMGEFEGQEIESVWPGGGWGQLVDGTILGLSSSRPPWSIGIHPKIRSAVGNVIVLVDGTILRAGLKIEHQALILPKAIWAATPRYYRNLRSLMMVDEKGRFSVIRDFPGIPLTGLSASVGRSASPRPVIGDILSMVIGKTDEVGHLVVLKKDGMILDLHFSQEWNDGEVRISKIFQVPGATMLETVEWGVPENLWGLVATEDGSVYGLNFRDLKRWRDSTSFRKQNFEDLYAEEEE